MKLIRKIRRKIIRTLYTEQWQPAVCDKSGAIISRIQPPKDTIWADPFPVIYEDRTFIFIEQQIKNKNGTLGFIELFEDLTWTDFTPILEADYHLSYPHIFQNEGLWYMIPETHENNKIDLYVCKVFPNIWKYHSTLIDTISAVDSTIINHNDTWYLFTSTQKEGFNSSLSIFYSDTFPSTNWKSHPNNPVIRGKNHSRMGGALFVDDSNNLIRPAQSSVKEYGEKLTLNKVIKLSKTHYSEEKIRVIHPEKKLNAVCTHTWNNCGNKIIRDIKTQKLKVHNWVKRIHIT